APSDLTPHARARFRRIEVPVPLRAWSIWISVLLVGVASAAPSVTFTDVTMPAGIRFVHNNGAFGKKYLPETLGAGGLFFDADGDGWEDVLFVNSMNWPGQRVKNPGAPGAKSYPALYHNNRNGSFTDLTRGSGIEVELYGM